MILRQQMQNAKSSELRNRQQSQLTRSGRSCHQNNRRFTRWIQTWFYTLKLWRLGWSGSSPNRSILVEFNVVCATLVTLYVMLSVSLLSLPSKKDEYDLVTLVGACGENHIPSAGFEQLARIVKPGELSPLLRSCLPSFTVEVSMNETHSPCRDS